MKYTDLELYVNQDIVEVWHNGRHFASLAISEEGQFLFKLTRPTETILCAGPLPSQRKALDVYIATREKEGHMALPKLKKQPANTVQAVRAARPTKAASSGTAESIENHERDQVLNAILDSLLDNPEASTKTTREETARIAKQFGEGVYVVAGVRAALTRGTYGDQAELVAKRRRERVKLARAVQQ